MKNKLVCLLVSVLLFSLFPIPAFALDGAVEIRTAAELDAVRNNLTGNYVLMNDIVFSAGDFASGGAYYNAGAGWVPIGDSGGPFSGTFDGNNFSVQGLKIFRPESDNIGLFGNMSGTVKNLSMKGNDISGNRYVGAICGSLKIHGIVENCSHDGYLEGLHGVAGIAGFCEGSVSGCINSGRCVASSSCAGGIVGDSMGSGVSGCENTGTIEAFERAGGIVGYATSMPVSNCVNRGTIKAGTAAGIAGGFMGSGTISISGCRNYSEITGAKAGGIIGDLANGSTVQECANYADITYAKKSTFGGIAANSEGFIKMCFNTGNIDVNGFEAVAGGIVGTSQGGTIRDSFNTGNVTNAVAASSCGGIAGRISSPIRNIINCYNTGYIEPTQASGDIVGERLAGSSENSYYLQESKSAALAGPARLGAGEGETPRTLAQMCDASTYSGFDFNAVWQASSGQTPAIRNMVCVYPTGISLDPGVSVAVGQVKKLAAAVSPADASNKNVIWKSTNPAVATVNRDGEITGIAAGTALITATSTSNNSLTASCTVTVAVPSKPVVGASSVILSKAATKQVDLSAVLVSDGSSTVTERGFVIYTSKNPVIGKKGVKRVVASSDAFAATVTGLKAGYKYYVRAYAINAKGTTYGAQKEFKTYIPITKFSLSKKKATVAAGKKLQLKANISPSRATNKKVIWSSGNTDIATVSAKGLVTVKPGCKGMKVVIICTSSDGSGKVAQCTITVK